ncbi:hypothetical protein LTR56_026275 [Elasticomyces elasticus]|nr:hypothetical protein LTR56_026275 [Elasticomyces elasticus]KAK5747784.1 hypothetical protein LTS12_022139 [Elasticomyces elasticus]
MDFPYGLWGQEADPWLPELNFFAMEAEPQLQSLAVDSAVERAKPWVLDHFRRRSQPSSPRPRGEEKSWYSLPPRLQMYDNEVLNVLLNVARRHLAPTFALFASYEAQSDSEPELCLAMAAIGALYLGAECGTTLSKALYNDARRLHFHRFHSSNLQPSFGVASASLKTFILLSIYGICSGDKRSYEFVEAFHSSLLQASRIYSHLISGHPDAATLQDVRGISEAIELLECYHVLLLQRPPCATPPQLRPTTSSSEKVQAALNPGLPGQAQGLHRSIAGLSAFAWAASCHGEELSCSRQLWRAEFVELAMERWIDGRGLPLSESDLPTILIYHLMHLRLKVNLNFLQKSARQFIISPSQTSSDHEELEHYVRGRPFAIAMWHAQAMLSMIQEVLDMPANSATSTCSKRMSEPPHLPYCIYFSTVTLWYGEFAKSGYRSLTRDACIKRGVRLLDRLKIRIARVFILALRELLPDE